MRLRAALAPAIWLTWAALLASSCHRLVPPPDLSPDPARLAAQVRAAQAPLRRVQGETRLRVDEPRTVTLRQFAAAERPDRVHLEELDFFGNPAAVLVAGGGRFSLYDSREKVLYRGAATPENLSRLVPLPLTDELLAAVVLGTVPLPEGAPASVAADGARLRLRYERGDSVEEFWIGAHAVVERMVRSVAGGAGPGSFQVDFGGHRPLGGAWFPRTVELRSAPAHVRLSLTWTQVEVNGEEDAGLFAPLAPPKGAKVVELGEGVGLVP